MSLSPIINPLSTVISPLSSNIVNLVSFDPVSVNGKSAPQVSNFSDILTEAFRTVEATDRLDKASAVETVTMQADDLSAVLIDSQKAEIALNLTLQIRNKVVDAYNEIMRMQV